MSDELLIDMCSKMAMKLVKKRPGTLFLKEIWEMPYTL